MGDRFSEADNVLAREGSVRLSDQIPEMEQNLTEIDNLEYVLTQFLDRLHVFDISGLSEEEIDEINRKTRQAQAYLDWLKKMREEVLAQIELLRKWNEERKQLHNDTKSDVDEAQAMVDLYSNAQPYKKADADRRAIDELAGRLLPAQNRAEKARDELRGSIPDCQAANDAADELVSQLTIAIDGIQVSI